MNDSRLKKSSDEVRVKLMDSNESQQHYWNLSENTDSQKEKISNASNSSKNSENSIQIEFDLSETRNMTHEQKQTILNTLILEDNDQSGDHSKEHSTSKKYSSLFPETGLIPLIALLAFLSFFFLVMIVAISAGPPYYYY